MDGFKRPRQPQSAPTRQPMPSAEPPAGSVVDAQLPQAVEPIAPLDTSMTVPHSDESRLRSPRRSRLTWIIAGIVALLLVVASVVAFWWYEQQLQPVDSTNHDPVRVEIKQGTSFTEITTLLHERGLIRSTFAFGLYAKLHGSPGVQASTCSLSKADAAAAILDKLAKGCHDFVSVTFYPGATIEKPLYKPPSATIDQDKMYIKGVLLAAGYEAKEIDAALAKQYTGELFADKPSGTSLEGYVFGETYFVDKKASVEDILKDTFAHMTTVVKRNDLVSKFRAQGLTLYQGITMASIVQRELNCEGKPTEERKQRCYGYQQHIAQVFLKRYKEGISLGSDVTFIYAADQMKVAPTVNLESPYNTRNRVGLPPGPIASPGELALKAVANPTATEDLYFIAGDDGLIYFAKDNAGHVRNIKQHCQILCNEL